MSVHGQSDGIVTSAAMTAVLGAVICSPQPAAVRFRWRQQRNHSAICTSMRFAPVVHPAFTEKLFIVVAINTQTAGITGGDFICEAKKKIAFVIDSIAVVKRHFCSNAHCISSPPFSAPGRLRQLRSTRCQYGIPRCIYCPPKLSAFYLIVRCSFPSSPKACRRIAAGTASLPLPLTPDLRLSVKDARHHEYVQINTARRCIPYNTLAFTCYLYFADGLSRVD